MKYRNEPDEEDDLDVHITSAEELKQMKENATEGPTDTENLNFNDSNSSSALQMVPRAESRQNQQTLISPKQIEPLKSVNGPAINNKTNLKNNGKTSNINSNNKSQKSITTVPIDAIEFAIDKLKEYIDFKLNNDLDIVDVSNCTDDEWTKFYEWFYAACQ
jgi:hypothetical protein